MTSQAPPARTGPRRLAARFGAKDIVFMVVAAAAPLTVVAGVVPVGIAYGNGASFPATYVVCTAILLLFSVGFTAMSRHVTNAGAFFAFVHEGLGRRAGVGTAFLALVSYTSVQLAVYGFIGASLDSLVTDHGGPDLPWYVWSAVALAVVGLLGYRNIALSGRVLGVLLVAEVAIVLVMSLAIVLQGGGDTGALSSGSFSPSGFLDGAPGIALIFAVAGYIGFEATVVFRDEARDPGRTIPRATYAALLLIGGFYAFASWALVSAYGDDDVVEAAASDPGGLLLATSRTFLGTFGSDLVQVLLVTSVFAAVLSFHNVLARYIFSLGHSRVFPERCGSSHEEHRSPHVASLVQSASAAVLVTVVAVAGLDPVVEVFTWFAGVASVGILALMLLTSVAVVAYFARRPGTVSTWHGLVAPAAACVGLATVLVLTIQNLPLLVGGSESIAVAVGLTLLLSFVGGVLLPSSTSTTHPSTDPQEIAS
ncbi:MAG: APC family permease [Aeromicrobium sp.]|uniref:APC family permease n=1 Tax=Aeromicrobium sp. TaxID=1871063 RepID=UPI00260FED70|nr:APC family permease [Aeromicrobium sp.]MDF1706128.1 APC family permease [Aeromicrobium sp.]